jgi:hypothetical protein
VTLEELTPTTSKIAEPLARKTCAGGVLHTAFQAPFTLADRGANFRARRARPAKRLGIPEVWPRGAQGALPPGPLLSSRGGHKWHISATTTDTTTTPVNASIVIRFFSNARRRRRFQPKVASAALCNKHAAGHKSPGKRSFTGKTSGTGRGRCCILDICREVARLAAAGSLCRGPPTRDKSFSYNVIWVSPSTEG